MMRRLTQFRNDESGTILILALFMVVFVAVALLALAGLAQANLLATTQLASSNTNSTASDASLDQVITQMLGDTSIGAYDSSNPNGCAGQSSFQIDAGAYGNSSPITVTCTAKPTSGQSTTTTETVTETVPVTNIPKQAILATSTTETGLSVGANPGGSGSLKIDGPVYSNSPLTSGSGSIWTAASAGLNAVGHSITARGACNGTFSPSCTPNALLQEGLTYDASADWASESIPSNVITNIAGHCGSGNPLVPGEYKDADALTTLATSCGASNQILWFQPGVYYFEFPTSSNVFSLSGPAVHVVGGQLTSTPMVPGSACKGETGTASQTDGVQWIFGASSHLSVTGQASLDLCPKPTDSSSTKQEIAVFGLRHTDSPAQVTTAGEPSTVATPSGNINGFANPNNAKTLADSGASASYTYPSSNPKKDGGIVLSNFGIANIPTGATINSAQLEVRYKSTSRSFKTLNLKLTDGDGTKTITSAAAPPCTNVTTANLCLGANGSGFFDQTFDLPTAAGGVRTPSGISTLAAEFDALLVNSGGNTADQTLLDGMKLTVSYTPAPAYTKQNGCVTDHTCDFIYGSGANSSIVVAGTVYAWDSSIRINLPSETSVALQRGAVASTFNITAPPSGIADQKVVSLPPDHVDITHTVTHTIAGDRDVVLVASIAGRAIIRSEVVFNDNEDGTANVEHWSDVG